MTDDQEKMLDKCLGAEEGLTAWEMDFIENLDLGWRKRELTERQAEVLETINGKII